jgi:NAD-dependent SIR2 family protein deacetylase
VDLLIVIGSSLKISPVSTILSQIPQCVPTVLINKELLDSKHSFESILLGDCDDVIQSLCGQLDWELDVDEHDSPAKKAKQESL